MEIIRDPVEGTAEYINAMIKVTSILDNEMGGFPRKLQFVNNYWERKKELLRECGVEWNTPAELNPELIK